MRELGKLLVAESHCEQYFFSGKHRKFSKPCGPVESGSGGGARMVAQHLL